MTFLAGKLTPISKLEVVTSTSTWPSFNCCCALWRLSGLSPAWVNAVLNPAFNNSLQRASLLFREFVKTSARPPSAMVDSNSELSRSFFSATLEKRTMRCSTGIGRHSLMKRRASSHSEISSALARVPERPMIRTNGLMRRKRVSMHSRFDPREESPSKWSSSTTRTPMLASHGRCVFQL